jgi:hypothetical protein
LQRFEVHGVASYVGGVVATDRPAARFSGMVC